MRSLCIFCGKRHAKIECDSPVSNEHGPPVAAPVDSQPYRNALDAVLDAMDDHQTKLTPEEWTRLQGRVNELFRLELLPFTSPPQGTRHANSN